MKRILSCITMVILVSVLLVSTVYAADRFSDISSHWAKNSINYLADKSILGGYGDGTFKPDGIVTRAEFIKMMTETFGLTATKTLYYGDVLTSDWFYPYISKASAQGFILEYGNYMYPNGELTREEAAALLARYLNLTDTVEAPYYPDYYSIGTQYRTYVLQATKAGLFAGYEDGSFRPQKTLTRAEALTILFRAAGGIYTSTSSGKDLGSGEQNAVISKGGITLSDIYLEGNVYITEGTAGGKIVLSGVNINGTLYIRSSAEITFTNCTITNVIVQPSISPMPSLKVYGTSLIYSLSVESAANVTVDSKAKVSDMTIKEGAPGTQITGTGTLADLKIAASGVTSEIIPTNYTIESSYKAVFGGIEYTKDGPVAAGTGFSKGYPYADTTNDGYIILTNKTEKVGTIYYTLIDKRTVLPSAKTIQNEGYSINITRIAETDSELRFRYNLLEDEDLAVVFVDASGNAYDPVRVFAAEDTGFYSASVKASTSSGTYYATYTLTSMAPGKAYIVAYRPDNVDEPTDSRLINYAEGTMSSSNFIVGGLVDMPAAGTTYTYNLVLPVSYSTYEWETAVIFITSDDVWQARSYAEISAYKEDLSPKKKIEGNGFINEPVIESGIYSYPQVSSLYDVVSFKTEETGKVYYYYTTSPTPPTAENFYNAHRSAVYNDYINVTGGQAVNDEELYYTKTSVAAFAYIVFSFCDSDGNYYEPVIVSRSAVTGTGFSGTPTFVTDSGTGINYISCTPLASGTVYYYYTSSQTPPLASDFMTNYSYTTLSGYTSVTSSLTYVPLISSASSVYNYIAVMFVDMYGNSYQPIVVTRTSSTGTNTGFTSTPSVATDSSGLDYLTAHVSQTGGTLLYYYTTSPSIPSSITFGLGVTGVQSIMLPYTSQSIPLGSASTYPQSTYPYIALMYTVNGVGYTPVVITRP